MIRFLSLLLVSGAVLFSPSAAAAAPQEAPRPNVLFILLDDLGYGQLGITGHDVIETPHIDRLAREGVRFANGYAGSTVCSPSRMSLMTGRDNSALRRADNSSGLRASDRTLAHVMQDAGYTTGLFGKYGIGVEFGKTDPMAMGFDHWVGLIKNIENHRQHPVTVYRNNSVSNVPGNIGRAKGTYAQRIFTDAAHAFLERQTPEKPFFAFVSYSSPHAELFAPEEFVAPYRGRFEEKAYPGLAGPGRAPAYARHYPEPVEQPNAVQAGMVAALDAYIGELLAVLDERGLAENTLVIFSSDNGPHSEGGGDPIGLSAAGPFRGGKRDLTEGGIHVPFFARWPAAIEAGRVVADPVHFADVLPTLADLAGKPEAAEAIGSNGLSFAELLTDPDAALPERMLYWGYQHQGGSADGRGPRIKQAGRIGKWKALRMSSTDPIELYDLEADPGEANDLAEEHPDVVADFAERLDAALERQAALR